MAGASLADLISLVGRITVPIDPATPDGPKISVTYRKNVWTQELEEEMNELAGELQPVIESGKTVYASSTVRGALLRIKSWDLTWGDGDSTVVPITAEGLKKLPTAFLQYLANEMNKDEDAKSKPDPTTGNA